MKPQLLEVKRDRFDLQNDQVYLLQGNWPKGYDLKAYLDTTELPAGKEPWESESALERFTESEMINGEKVTVRVTLPEEISSGKRLYVYACAEVSGAPGMRCLCGNWKRNGKSLSIILRKSRWIPKKTP